MELEFDKEIDAILRKARDSGAAAVQGAHSPHADADAIAAFAENALPAKAREMYVRHFADCDRCRQMLSQSVAPIMDEVPAAPTIATNPQAIVRPWYERLFHPAKLAAALGAIVLAFTGIIGYLAIQTRKGTERTDVAQMRESSPRLNSSSSTANTSSNAASANALAPLVDNTAAVNSAPETSEQIPSPTVRPSGPSAGSSDVAATADPKLQENKPAAETADKAAKPVMAAPPPSAARQPAAPINQRNTEPSKLKGEAENDAVAKSEGAGIRNEAGLSSNSSAKRAGGPRNMTQVQQQQQSVVLNDRALENPVRRKVGGKTFDRREGAWYDMAYHGAATQNYRRGTDEYKKLDAGLRSVADSLGGTVVIVWKGKALRVN
jgi:hypothetical protein